jgi:glycosyltransferase involved in cell wall biosynthesis
VRITIEATTWTNQRGYGRFLREIVGAAVRLNTPHEFTLVADTSLPADTVVRGAAIVRVPLRVPAGVAASAAGRRSLADMWTMSRALGRAGGDCLFFPTVYSYVPVWTRTPVVVGIHDVIAETLPAQVFDSARARRFWSAKVWIAARQAARVVTVSRHAAAGVARMLKIDDARLRVVGEAPAEVFRADADLGAGRSALDRMGVPPGGRFFLYVGGIAPHKNIGALIAAIDAMPQDVRLIIVGDFARDSFLSAYPALASRAAQMAGRVSFTGRLDDHAVAALMRLSLALVLPSFDEGFGLPAVEAAACGAAVIATKNSAIPEVLGDAALIVDPDDPSTLVAAMRQVVADPESRQSLGARAAARVRGWTWEAAARRLIAVFEELAP